MKQFAKASIRPMNRTLSLRRAFLHLGVALATTLVWAGPAAALERPANCQVDPRGANDRPGQKDVTMYCVDRGDGAPYEFFTATDLDEIRVTGANTIDSCMLFDTDDDAFANLALCTTLGSSGAAGDNMTRLANVRLLTCNDTKADRCAGSTLIPPPYVTTCEADHPDTDPFSPAAPHGPGDDYPYDSEIRCAIDLHDFGVAITSLRMMDGCSYPSSVPNSASEDCVLYTTCVTAAACDDLNPCTVDTCDPSGACKHLAAEPIACSDGLFCTGQETCNDLGYCGSGSGQSCDDGIDCTIDTCDELTDACVHDPRASLCDDGSFCDGVEDCDPAAGCVAGTPPSCDDSVACTADACDAATDACASVPQDAACDDGAFCNGAETCDAVAGCLAGTAPDCSDGIGCTADSCDEATNSCAHAPDPAPCSNGLFCDGAEVCDTAAGCRPGPAPDCNDGVSCTADSCDEAKDLCLNTPNNAACSDGVWCNGVEACDTAAGCQAGEQPCTGSAFCDETIDQCLACLTDSHCNDGVFCNGTERCSAGVCVAGTPVSCNDGFACTTDSCSEAEAACVHLPSDALCDDLQFCNGVEICNAATGCEPGTAVICDDGVACTQDACNEVMDSCQNLARDSSCDDGLGCNGAETCDEIEGCVEGEPVTCPDDGVVCSTERCDAVTDACVSDFSQCLCGDREVTFPEECDPPATAGTFEDCNNGIDDNHDGKTDCVDPSCHPGSPRASICGEDCLLDRICERVGRDPAVIKFQQRSGPDSLWVHGRFPIEGDLDPSVDGLRIEISNGIQPIYEASLGVSDLVATAAGGTRYSFTDKLARKLGDDSPRDGLGKVGLDLVMVDGVPYLSFRIRAYGDFSAATHRVMNTQVTVGTEVGGLTAEWQALPGKWILKQKDF